MTLHWWMHWFWVTVNFAIIFGAPATPITTTTTEKIYQNHETIKPMFVTKIPPSPPSEIKISISSTMIPFYQINNNNNNIRNAKAIYSNEPSRKKNNGNLAGPDVQKQQSSISSKPDKYRHVTTTTTTRNNYQFLPTILKEFNNKNLSMGITKEEFEMQNDSPGDEKEEKDTVQIKTITKTEILWIESTTNGPIRFKNNHDNLAVLPLEFKEEEEEEEEEVDVVVNKSNINNNNNNNRDKVSFNRQTINKSESLIFVSPSSVSSPILEASIEKLNRNDNGRFSSRNFDNIIGAEDRSFNINIVNDINEDSQSVVGGRDDNNNNNNFTALNIAVIAASCLAIFILITTMTTFGLIMYRRKYLNPPQTLNSDKCSNPDSSGYIDDSTIRDNSEEMYSLDNDSFLNSLEAMTIQNYWTDSVKHTKL